MPTYLLDGDRPVSITAGPFRATVTGSAAQVDVVVVAASQSVPAIAPRTGLLVVPALAGSAVLRVVPVGAPEFDRVASITLSLDREGVVGEAERVVVGPVDVAGLRHRDVVVVERIGDHIAVRSVADIDDGELSDVAAASRAAARAAENVAANTLPTRELAIALDASASMAARYRDGSVGTVVELVAGLDALVPKGSTLPIALVGEHAEWLPEGTDLARLAAELRTLPGRRTLASTAAFERVDPPLDLRHVPRLIVRVTDEPAAARAVGVHTVLLLAQSAADVAGVDSATTTVIEPVVSGSSIPERFASAPAELRRTVESLLRGLGAAAEEVPA